MRPSDFRKALVINYFIVLFYKELQIALDLVLHEALNTVLHEVEHEVKKGF